MARCPTSHCGRGIRRYLRTGRWKTLPSWAIIATEDVGAGMTLSAQWPSGAGAKVTELKGSHAIMNLAATGRGRRDSGGSKIRLPARTEDTDYAKIFD